jgi:hypothetical protein
VSGPIIVGDVVLGGPVVIGPGGTSLGDPIVVGPAVGGDVGTDQPVPIGGWTPSPGPITPPTGGGTLPVIEGHGPPAEFIPGAKVGQYYLDVDSGYLYRLGAS